MKIEDPSGPREVLRGMFHLRAQEKLPRASVKRVERVTYLYRRYLGRRLGRFRVDVRSDHCDGQLPDRKPRLIAVAPRNN